MITTNEQGDRKEWIFTHKAISGDVCLFKAWENRQIDTATASKRLAKNNEWDSVPSPREFLQMANGFGYRRMFEEFFEKHFG